MDAQTVIVIVLAIICVVFLVRRYQRAAKGSGSCGCGCGDDCPSTGKNNCGEKENLNERRPD